MALKFNDNIYKTTKNLSLQIIAWFLNCLISKHETPKNACWLVKFLTILHLRNLWNKVYFIVSLNILVSYKFLFLWISQIYSFFPAYQWFFILWNLQWFECRNKPTKSFVSSLALKIKSLKIRLHLYFSIANSWIDHMLLSIIHYFIFF